VIDKKVAKPMESLDIIHALDVYPYTFFSMTFFYPVILA
jgi:hypothetical protein